MGREIKVKAWDEELKLMYDGDEIESRDDLQAYLSYGELVIFRITNGEYTQLTNLQCTGLPDKNGKVIYDGDILQVPDLYETPENTSTTYHTDVIDFEEYGWRLGGSQLCEDYQYISYECEVVGNIYENPELIEV